MKRSTDDTSDDDDERATEGLPSLEAARAHVRECHLEVVDGPGRGAAFLVGAERTVIGAHPSADVVLEDTTLSKFHCELRLVEGRALVRDLGSRNGTWVDRVRVLEAPLAGDELLTLGRTQLRFRVGTRQVPIPLSSAQRFGRLRGGSVAMRAAFARLERAAASDATVLLQGETGTGKDVAAESIHHESARRDGPFVVVDCGALPPHLIESELFGHERGAFTGAHAARAGALESAAGGTVFFDEIGELALALQPKLLRAIERKEVRRVGGMRAIPVDARVIVATNRNLLEEVNARRFRSDLYFRIAVLVITLPPLRERVLDLPLLVDAILGDLGARGAAAAASLGEEPFLRELARHPWPGNVRELRNHVEARLAREEGASPLAATGDEPPAIDPGRPLREVRDRWIRWVERRYLAALLEAHGGSVSAAARTAGVDRVHLHRLLARVGLR